MNLANDSGMVSWWVPSDLLFEILSIAADRQRLQSEGWMNFAPKARGGLVSSLDSREGAPYSAARQRFATGANLEVLGAGEEGNFQGSAASGKEPG